MKTVKLTDVVNIKNESVKRYEGKKSYVATGDIDGTILRSYSDVFYDEKPSRANIQVSKGQVIFARMKETTKVLLIDDNNVDYIYSTGFCVLEPKKQILSEYLNVVIKSSLFQNQKDKYSKGATQKAINNDGLKKIIIPLPPLQTQNKIVEVLDKAQELIDARKEQIKLLDDLMQSVFYDMFGDGYEYKRITVEKACKEIFDCPHSTPKYSDKNTLYRCLRTSNLGKGYIDWGNLAYVSEKTYHERIQRYTPQIGDVVYSREGAILGIAALVNKDINMCLGQRLMIFTLDSKRVNSIFFWMMLNSCFVRRQVELNIGGAAAPRINIKDIKKIEIFLPLIETQNIFAHSVQKIESQKELMHRSLTELKNNFNSLMQKAFKGELFKD